MWISDKRRTGRTGAGACGDSNKTQEIDFTIVCVVVRDG